LAPVVVGIIALTPLAATSSVEAATSRYPLPDWPRSVRANPPLDSSSDPGNSAIASAISAVIDGQAGTFGIAVRNLKTGQDLVVGDDFFPSASLYKLAVMYEVFRQNSLGTLSFDETLAMQDQDLDEGTDDEPLSLGEQVTIEKALEEMIDVSSNAAGRLLATRVGWVQINQSMADLGYNHTRLPVGDWKAQVSDWRSDTACTSPSDMLVFFDRLYHHQLVSPAASDQMLKLLLNQQINDRLPADLPSGTAVAHKTGNLEGVVNDAGIVYGPNASFILVVLSHDADDGNATAAEAALARSLYDQFNGPGAGSGPAPAPTDPPAPVALTPTTPP